MFNKIILALLLMVSSLLSAEIHWEKDYDSAIKRATAENKPVFFNISKTTCPPCIRMKKTTFKDPAVIAMLNKDFVSIIAYTDENDHIPRHIPVQYTPSSWFLKPDGEPIYEPLVGGIDAESFLRALNIVKDDFEKEVENTK
jgi:uncharacterized protein YyaL (SSP411 family)